MLILLTNDDGIGASGLNALRRALIDHPAGFEVAVVAPDANRSATARSITTRSPLRVEEIHYEDGTTGYATAGTPVDCVRFADLGLIGGRKPDLIVSGINHGSNLGDDVTYSGTVAAALEGIVLGIPSLAFSQESIGGGLDFRAGRGYDFDHSAPLAAEIVAEVAAKPLPDGTLLNVNFPAGPPNEIEIVSLGKRIYDDELELVETDESSGHKSYRIYGFEPSFEDLPGTDLRAVAGGKVAITPLHFDLTDHAGMKRLESLDAKSLLARAQERVAASQATDDG